LTWQIADEHGTTIGGIDGERDEVVQVAESEGTWDETRATRDGRERRLEARANERDLGRGDKRVGSGAHASGIEDQTAG
jgi:hypothetical protein